MDHSSNTSIFWCRFIRRLATDVSLLGDAPSHRQSLFAQARRRHPIAAAESVVEPAEARKAAGERHLGNRPGGLRQQLFRQQQPARQQQLNRRNPSSFWTMRRIWRELSSNWSAIASSPACSSRCPPRGAARSAGRSAAHRRPARCRAPVPDDSAGTAGSRPVRPPAAVEEAAVGRLRRLHRADRPAVDAGRGDADEEDAVEARIARRERLVELRCPGPSPHDTATAPDRLAIFGHVRVRRADVRKWRAVDGAPAYRRGQSTGARWHGRSLGHGASCVQAMDSPVGTLTLVASDNGLAAILWENDRPGRAVEPRRGGQQPPVLVETERQLRSISPDSATVRVEAGFRRNGLSAQGVERAADDPVRRDPIVRGRSRRQIGSPNAVRAVGAANGRNPIRSSRRAIASLDPPGG